MPTAVLKAPANGNRRPAPMSPAEAFALRRVLARAVGSPQLSACRLQAVSFHMVASTSATASRS
jgi:hypothetical protein